MILLLFIVKSILFAVSILSAGMTIDAQLPLCGVGSSGLKCSERSITVSHCLDRGCCWNPAEEPKCVERDQHRLLTASNSSISSWFSSFPWSQYSRDMLLQSHVYDRGDKYPRVYYAIFAGRSNFLKIHLQYCNILLQLNYVTEVHIWDVTAGDDEDTRDYISKFIRDTDLAGYRLFGLPSYSTAPSALNFTNSYLYGSFYIHYLNTKRYSATDILIKADDDIVFIDLSHFARFINAVAAYEGPHLHFPNIINNDAGFIIQTNRLNNSALNKWKDFYTLDLHLNLSERIMSMLNDSQLVSEPLTTWHSGVHTHAEFAFDMHEAFLTSPRTFLKDMHQLQLSSKKAGERPIAIYGRVATNMFAGRMDVIQSCFRSFLWDHCCDFDSFTGIWSSISGQQSHLLHADFLVSHFAFQLQYYAESNYSAAFEAIIVVYEEIANKFSRAATHLIKFKSEEHRRSLL